MATLQQALTRIDAICPNAWDETAKLLWLNECESMIQTRILGTAPEQCITYDADTDRSTKLLVPAPFDRLYVYYVIAMCDYAAHETAHYTDSMMLFNAALDEYAKWYQRTNGATASTPGLVKEIAANTKARHTHKNLAVLDGITAGKMAAWNAKADKAAATQKSDGLMSAADKRKLDTVEAHAKDVDVDDTLSPVSTAAIMNKTVTAALNAKAGTAAATTSANGLMSSADKVKLDGVEDGATKTIVDDAMSDTSTNPVQNKAVKAALDSKLSTQGGEILGHLSVGLTVSAEGSVSTGRTSTDTGIHFEKAGSDVGRISHGSDPMTGVAPIARLKVASPTEDDDAATKAYVDGRAVRYDAAQTLTDAQKAQARENVDAASAFTPILTSPVMIRKERATDSAGVYLSTIDIGEKHAEIRLEDVNENAPVAIANLRTPTGAGKDDYAATKGYVDSKVASVGGSPNAVLYTAQTLTDAQKKQARENIDAASDFVVNGTANSDLTVTLDKTFAQIQAAIQEGKQPVAKLAAGGSTAILPFVGSSETAVAFMAGSSADENYIGFSYLTLLHTGKARLVLQNALPISPSGVIEQVSMAVDPTADMQIATKQYVDNSVASTPLVLTYANNQATGASYSDIRKAIERGRQIKLSVANTPDIIASNARNETNKSVLKFIHTDVGGDTVNITQYTVTAQASGLTVNVKSHEIA